MLDRSIISIFLGVKLTQHSMDELVALCKRRGFIFQSNEIYGGLQGLYDYVPLGIELKNNLKTPGGNQPSIIETMLRVSIHLY